LTPEEDDALEGDVEGAMKLWASRMQRQESKVQFTVTTSVVG
jgi:hypothetical protein